MQWFIKEQVEEVATMSDLLAVVTRNLDDVEDIEEYVAREQNGEDADPTAPRDRRRLTDRPRRGAGYGQTPRMARVIVVGAGVVGLTCAVRLLEAGHRVDVRRTRPAAGDDLARSRPRSGTPTAPSRRTGSTAWSRRVVRRVRRRWRREPDTGVRMLTGHRGARRAAPRPVVAPGGAVAGPARPRCRRATATAGRSSRRWSRCRSTCAGWPPGSRRSAAPSPG